MFKKTLRRAFQISLSIFLSTIISLPVHAATIDYASEAENRKSWPIESNDIENWPDGPQIGAASAILMEANTKTILYAKNIHEKQFPASITKIMTSMLAMEKIESLDTMIPFSNEAIFSIDRGSSNAGIDVGEELTFEECLYIMLLYSANEVCNGVAEKAAGDIPSFVNLMNERAKELGCENTHFNNTNGLPDDLHYTTAYDFALIASEFFKNETLSKISGTRNYTILPSAKQPDTWEMSNHHKLCSNMQFSYEYFVGGKTGYTNLARQTLVSCAEKDGMRLICVILKEESPDQFNDTISLFDYGFANFQNVSIAENEVNYVLDHSDFFESNSDVFGKSQPIMTIDDKALVTIPKTVDFKDTLSELSYDQQDSQSVATIHYSYNGVSVGNANVMLTDMNQKSYDFDSPVVSDNTTSSNGFSGKIIFINILKVLGIIMGIAFILILILFVRAFIKNYHFSRKRNSKIRRKKRRKKRLHFDDYDYR